MTTAIAAICLLVVVVCVPLVFVKPHWVFYIFLTVEVFANILYSYIAEAGNLGAPRAWHPGDMLVWLTLVAAALLPRNTDFPSDIIKQCLIITALVGLICFVQGLVMDFHVALSHIRMLYFVPAMLFAMRYFITARRFQNFLRFVTILITVMFAVHVCIRFGVYEPPIVRSEDILKSLGQLIGERGERSVVPGLYLVLVSIGIARLASKSKHRIISAIILVTGVAGVALTETRTWLGGIVVIGLVSLFMIRGRMRVVFVYGIAILVVVWIAGAIGFDVLKRLRWEAGGQIVSPVEAVTRAGYRRMEYGALVNTYKEQPYFLLTGRGVGAMHYIPAAKARFITYYHSEYLAWLDKFGVIGLTVFIILCIVVPWQSYQLARSEIPYLANYGITSFLLMMAVVACGVFVPIFWQPRGGPIFICFVAIIANRQVIQYNLQEDFALLEEDLRDDLEYSQELMV